MRIVGGGTRDPGEKCERQETQVRTVGGHKTQVRIFSGQETQVRIGEGYKT